MKYVINDITDLTRIRILSIIQDFRTRELPRLRKYGNYYEGKQKILQKAYSDPNKPCNKIVTNFCDNIVKNYEGYIAGQDIKYENQDDKLQDVLNYNDIADEDSEFLEQCLIYGKAYEVLYIDSDKKIRFKLFDTLECIPIYLNSLEEPLVAVIRLYHINPQDTANEEWSVEVYLNDRTDYYKSTPGYASLTPITSQPNYFNQVPVIVFEIKDSIFKKIIDLQDAYNSILSDNLDDFDAFADAYLTLKGMSGTTSEDIAKMKEDRVLLLDTDGDASFLVKNMTDAETQERLDGIEKHIYKVAQCIDFMDEAFMAQSGVAIRYKLMSMENRASTIVSSMKKALQKRIELIYSILSMTEGESLWRDVNINFTRNIPDLTIPTTPQEVMSYRNFVSDKTLLSLLPFVKDIDEEMRLVKQQMANSLSLYNFHDNDDEDEDDNLNISDQ